MADEGKWIIADIDDYENNKSENVQIDYVGKKISDNKKINGSVVVNINIGKVLYNAFLNKKIIKVEVPGWYKEEFVISEYHITAL